MINMKQHLRNAGNMTPTQVIAGTGRFLKNGVKLGFQLVGAVVYVGDKAVRGASKVIKDGVVEGYKGTDTIINRPKPQATYRPVDTEPQ